MPIIAFIQQKGGSGKTTLVGNLVHEFALMFDGKAVAYDLDAQQSLTHWANCFGSGEKGGALRTLVQPIQERFAPTNGVVTGLGDALAGEGRKYVLLDTAAGVPDSAIMAALVADLVVLPIMPSGLDLFSVSAAVELARHAQHIRLSPSGKARVPQIAVAPTRVSNREQNMRDLHIALQASDLPVLPAIGRRAGFVNCMNDGLTLREHTRGLHVGVQEIRSLAEAIVKLLRGE